MTEPKRTGMDIFDKHLGKEQAYELIAKVVESVETANV